MYSYHSWVFCLFVCLFSVKEGVLRGLPDLAGREARTNTLGPSCKKEQKQAGLLHDLSAKNRQLINDFNAEYKAKFDFPFVICARKNKVETILEGFKSRIGNSRKREVDFGINEIKMICWFRICDIISDHDSSLQQVPNITSKL